MNSETDNLPGTQRIEAFSDGVIAIVITLMVLEIKIPNIPADVSDREALAALEVLLPKFLAYLFSFLMIGIFWVNHHQFFHSVRKSDRALLWLNNHLLFWLCLVPFPTAFLGEHPFLKTALASFAFVLFMASLAFYMMRFHGFKKDILHENTVTEKDIKKTLSRGLVAPVLYLVALCCVWISVYIAYFMFVAVPVLFFFPILDVKPKKK
jgi:uncharacterized membrane protein